MEGVFTRRQCSDRGKASGEGKRDSFSGEKIDRRQFTTSDEYSDEPPTFSFFSCLFNVVLDYLRKGGQESPVEKVVHAGPSETVSTGSSAHRPDAFLHMVTQTSPPPGKIRWRDLTCPFEYKFEDGEVVDVSRPEFIACRDRVLISS